MGETCSTYGKRRGAYRILVGRSEGTRSLRRSGIDARIILKCIFKKWDGLWAELIWLSIGRRGSCECGNEPSVSMYCGKYFLTN
jgi:hypothetical protein